MSLGNIGNAALVAVFGVFAVAVIGILILMTAERLSFWWESRKKVSSEAAESRQVLRFGGRLHDNTAGSQSGKILTPVFGGSQDDDEDEDDWDDEEDDDDDWDRIEDDDKNPFFVTVEEHPTYDIVRCVRTGVLYYRDGDAFTLLVNADGRPMLYGEPEDGDDESAFATDDR